MKKKSEKEGGGGTKEKYVIHLHMKLHAIKQRVNSIDVSWCFCCCYCCFCPFYSFICLQSWFFLVPCRSVLSFKMRAILKVFSAFWWFAQEIWLILFVNVIHLFVVYSIGTAETAIQSIVRTIEVSLFLFNLFMGIFQSLLALLLLWCSRARSAVNSFVLCHV